MPYSIAIPSVLTSDDTNIIFGYANSTQMLELSLETGQFVKLGHMPSADPSGHSSCYFELHDDRSFGFIYGAGIGAHTYDIQNKKWHINSHDFDFGNSLSMITDIQNKNTVHLIAGEQPAPFTKGRYGKIKFNEDSVDSIGLFFFFDIFCFFFVVLVYFFFLIFFNA